MRFGKRREYVTAAVISAVSLTAIVGCPELGEAIDAPQTPSGSAFFGGSAKTVTFSSSNGGGPVDPRQDSTIEVVVYSSETLPLSAFDITAYLMQGDAVYESYPMALTMTSFEPPPPGTTGSTNDSLTTRYVGTLTTSCTECDPWAVIPDNYSWEVTVTGTDDASGVVHVYFDYELYLGPIVSP